MKINQLYVLNLINEIAKEKDKTQMKIKDLYVLNLLDEMASAMLNHKVDNDFYDYYMEKDLSWLFDNREKIINDVINNYDKLEFDFRAKYYNYLNKWNKNELKKAVEDMIKESE